MKTFIFIQTQFEAIHRWENAPDDVAFLRNYHRHIFHIKLRFPIQKDREIEFIQMKSDVNRYIYRKFDNKCLDSTSCEQICSQLKLQYPNACYISVSEDGENGAELIDEDIS